MNLIRYIKILKDAKPKNFGSYFNEIEYRKALQWTIELIKNTDEYKKQEQEFPLLQVFIDEHSSGQYSSFILKFKDSNKEDIVISEGSYWLYKNSILFKDYVVLSHTIKCLKKGEYYNQGNFSFSSNEYTLIIDVADKYDNVRKEAN